MVRPAKWRSRPSRSVTRGSNWLHKRFQVRDFEQGDRAITAYVTPGIYLLPPPPPPPDIRLVKTDIAGFVGFAERGPVLQKTDADPAGAQAALKLTSWQDFRLKFGGFISNSFLAYAVRAFFANGGASCYVV